MAGEIQLPYDRTGRAVYALLRTPTATIYQTTTQTFVTYVTANRANYDIVLTEQGTASRHYVGDMPAVAAGLYNLIAHDNGTSGAPTTPAEGDPFVGTARTVYWSGTALVDAAGFADALLNRNVLGGSSAGRLVKEALAASRNRVALDVPAAGQFTVFGVDDVTPLWTGTYTRGVNTLGPLTAVDAA